MIDKEDEIYGNSVQQVERISRVQEETGDAGRVF